jgi:hypothetical protein
MWRGKAFFLICFFLSIAAGREDGRGRPFSVTLMWIRRMLCLPI